VTGAEISATRLLVAWPRICAGGIRTQGRHSPLRATGVYRRLWRRRRRRPLTRSSLTSNSSPRFASPRNQDIWNS